MYHLYRLCLFFLLFISNVSETVGQSVDQFDAILADYLYLKEHRLLAVDSAIDPNSTSNPHFEAKFPRTLLDKVQLNYSIGISDPFLPPEEAIPQAIKRASFLQALRNSSKAFAVIDVYTKVSEITRREVQLQVKELIKVFVDSLYSIKNAQIIKHEYLETGELILTVDFRACEKKSTTALFEIYRSTKEKGPGLQKTSRIKLTNQDEEYLYKRCYHGNEITSNGIALDVDFDNYYFTYVSYKTKYGIKGGLWSYLIGELSESIAKQAVDKTTITKTVRDDYLELMNIDLTRNVGFYHYEFAYNSFIYSLRQF